MYKILVLLQIAFFSLNATEYRVTNITKEAELAISKNDGVFHFKSQQKPNTPKLKKAVSFGFKPITAPDETNAISFEVQGDGSQFYASIFLGNSKYLTNQYEAIFPLHSTDWQKITIPFTTFCWAYKSLNESFDYKILKKKLKADYISMIGFGRGFKYHRFPHPNYSFKIRNIQFEAVVEEKDLPIQKGLDETRNKITANKDLNVLLIGDSITESGHSNTHTAHAFKSLNYSGSANIVNAAIGGHTARAANIILPRTVAKMPNPDLIVIFLGANDCNSLCKKPEISEGIFEYQLLSLITRVNNLTESNAEFLLVNGMPRISREDMKSVGKVETISGAYTKLKEKYGLEVVDTMSVFNKLGVEDMKAYYNDTIHPKQEGHKFISKFIAEKLQ